jgi:hypothetical protein
VSEQLLPGGAYDHLSPPMETALLTGRVSFSPMLPLHALFYWSLKHSPHPQKQLSDICEQKGLNFELICRALAVLPLRWIIASLISGNTQDLMLPKSVADSLHMVWNSKTMVWNFQAFIGHVQLMFAISPIRMRS